MIYALNAAAWVIRAVQRVLPNKKDWLDLHAIEIALPGLPAAFDGYRIAQFSDLHFDRMTTTPARLSELVAAINAQQPDMIAFTGDFVTEDIPFRTEDLISPLRELHARDVKVAIFGNHDHHVNMKRIRQVMNESGLIDLNNNVTVIQRGESSLRIAGVDSLVVRKARLDLVLPRLPQNGGAILLAHEPSFAEFSAPTGRFALQLSGHTHGGQIRLPLLTALMLRYIDTHGLLGLNTVGSMLLYVNRGIGMVGLPLRIRCPSELTIITLRGAG